MKLETHPWRARAHRGCGRRQESCSQTRRVGTPFRQICRPVRPITVHKAYNGRRTVPRRGNTRLGEAASASVQTEHSNTFCCVSVVTGRSCTGQARRTDRAVLKALDATVSLRSQPELKVRSSKLSYLPNHMAVLTLPKCEGIMGADGAALLATHR